MRTVCGFTLRGNGDTSVVPRGPCPPRSRSRRCLAMFAVNDAKPPRARLAPPAPVLPAPRLPLVGECIGDAAGSSVAITVSAAHVCCKTVSSPEALTRKLRCASASEMSAPVAPQKSRVVRKVITASTVKNNELMVSRLFTMTLPSRRFTTHDPPPPDTVPTSIRTLASAVVLLHSGKTC